MRIWLMIYDKNYQKVIRRLKKERKKEFAQEEFTKQMEQNKKQ